MRKARNRTRPMPRGVKSASLPRRSKRKGSALGRRLVAGLPEALAHARGEIELPNYTVAVPDRVDVTKLRHRPVAKRL
jgi:hypothetical protein